MRIAGNGPTTGSSFQPLLNLPSKGTRHSRQQAHGGVSLYPLSVPPHHFLGKAIKTCTQTTKALKNKDTMALDWSNYDAYFGGPRQQSMIDDAAKQELERLGTEILQLTPTDANILWGVCSPPGSPLRLSYAYPVQHLIGSPIFPEASRWD